MAKWWLRRCSIPDGRARCNRTPDFRQRPLQLSLRRTRFRRFGWRWSQIQNDPDFAVTPKFLLADEPFSGVDVSQRNQILNYIMRVIEDNQIGVLYISHDIHLIREVSKKIAVMYDGSIVEVFESKAAKSTLHPYTKRLFSANPSVKSDMAHQVLISGEIQSGNASQGCKYTSCCQLYQSKGRPIRCCEERPVLTKLSVTHHVACDFASL